MLCFSAFEKDDATIASLLDSGFNRVIFRSFGLFFSFPPQSPLLSFTCLSFIHLALFIFFPFETESRDSLLFAGFLVSPPAANGGGGPHVREYQHPHFFLHGHFGHSDFLGMTKVFVRSGWVFANGLLYICVSESFKG